MNSKIKAFIVEKNQELNIIDQIIIDEISEKAERDYNLLLFRGYNEKKAVNRTIKLLKQFYNKYWFDNILHTLSHYKTHKVINLLMLVINCFNFLAYYNLHVDLLVLVIINVASVGCLLLTKRYYLLHENVTLIKSEYILFFQNLCINLAITFTIFANQTRTNFFLDMGLLLLGLNLLYFLFKGPYAKRLFCLSVPASIMSLVLLSNKNSYLLILQILIFIFLFYLIYLLININFNFANNQVFGIASICCLLLIILWKSETILRFFIPLVALILVALIMRKWFNYQLNLTSVRVIITFYMGILIGYFIFKLFYDYYIDINNINSQFYIDEVSLIMLLLGVEMLNTISFVSFRKLENLNKLKRS